MNLPLLAYVFASMVDFIAPSARNIPQLTRYVLIADAIVHATNDPEDAVQLASITSFESRFAIEATGKRGERGPWQLMAPAPVALRDQAKEALRRWKVQGACGYTGEATVQNQTDLSKCPLARHRIERAQRWLDAHPFVRREPDTVASLP